MMVLGIYGSPRKGGNTDLMLDAFLEGASETVKDIERIYVRDLDIHGCLACGHCDKKGRCIQKDDMNRVYSLMDQATHIVVASPVYFYGVTGQLKLLIDRSQACFMRWELEKKQGRNPGEGTSGSGYLLAAGATRGKRLFECTVLSVRYFFDALNYNYVGDLCLRELDEKGAILLQPLALDDCRRAGREFVLPPAA
ncbi:MAG: flavodoxin family protein [Syntrophobacteraceae bacterium]|nr:flavodoxin family protein [Syntrophobacteraceae bacterium]